MFSKCPSFIDVLALSLTMMSQNNICGNGVMTVSTFFMIILIKKRKNKTFFVIIQDGAIYPSNEIDKS